MENFSSVKTDPHHRSALTQSSTPQGENANQSQFTQFKAIENQQPLQGKWDQLRAAMDGQHNTQTASHAESSPVQMQKAVAKRLARRLAVGPVTRISFVESLLEKSANPPDGLDEMTDTEIIIEGIDAGLTNGENPYDPITRIEAATMINRFLGVQDAPIEGNVFYFADIYPGDWMFQQAHVSRMFGVFMGTRENTFLPTNTMNQGTADDVIDRAKSNGGNSIEKNDQIGHLDVPPLLFPAGTNGGSYSIENGLLTGEDGNDFLDNRLYEALGGSNLGNLDASSIVLHRTVSDTSDSALNSSINNAGNPSFHIIIDKDGSITQLLNFDHVAYHVGTPKGDSGASNATSIGIEVVGQAFDSNGNTIYDPNYNGTVTEWEPLTEEQIENTAQTVVALMQAYDLSTEDLFPHEDVSYKTEGEGRTVLEAIIGRVEELA